jgi:hypothetical protein
MAPQQQQQLVYWMLPNGGAPAMLLPHQYGRAHYAAPTVDAAGRCFYYNAQQQSALNYASGVGYDHQHWSSYGDHVEGGYAGGDYYSPHHGGYYPETFHREACDGESSPKSDCAAASSSVKPLSPDDANTARSPSAVTSVSSSPSGEAEDNVLGTVIMSRNAAADVSKAGASAVVSPAVSCTSTAASSRIPPDAFMPSPAVLPIPTAVLDFPRVAAAKQQRPPTAAPKGDGLGF